MAHCKNRSLLLHLLLLSLFVFPVALNATESSLPLEIQGQWYPGSMLLGKTLAGAKVSILGRTIVADSKGKFVFGLGRDVSGEVELLVEAGDTSAKTKYTVKPRKYKLQRINGVASKYVSPPASVLKRISRETARIRQARSHTSELYYFLQDFIWPAQGPITGVYGSQRIFNGEPKRPHFGLDIAGPVGAPVVAPASGVVTLVDDDMYYSGGTLIIDHGQGISSTFIHLSKILVKPGQVVTQGELIAKIGATGRVTGPHLDWRINWYEQRLDPQLVLPAQEQDTSAK